MTETLIIIASALLSLGFSYIPRLSEKYATLDERSKRLIMASLLLLTTVGIFSLACLGVLNELTGLSISCERESIFSLLRAFIAAIISNQGVYQLSPQTRAVKRIKSLVKDTDTRIYE